MSSLKSFLARMAPVLETTSDALYERQRALVRLGILRPIPGRGPGSGVELSCDSLAVLLISVGAAAGLSDVDSRITDYCNATIITDSPSGICPLTGEKKLRAVMKELLSNQKVAERVDSVTFHHDQPLVKIHYDKTKLLSFSKAELQDQSRFSMFSQFSKEAISETAMFLAEERGFRQRLEAHLLKGGKGKNRDVLLERKARKKKPRNDG
jgi:hypothetical protein